MVKGSPEMGARPSRRAGQSPLMIASGRTAAPSVSLVPAAAMELEMTAAQTRIVSMHTGIPEASVRRRLGLIRLGEMNFVAKRLRHASVDETEIIPAESVVREVVDGPRLSEDARSTMAWEASILMAEYLREHGRPILADRRIIEVGAGIGIVGFTAAEVAPDARITLTDGVDEAVGLLHTNKHMNAMWLGPDSSSRVHVRTLRWDDDEDAETTMDSFGPFDCAMGAGVLHSTEAAQSLAVLLPRLLEPPAHPESGLPSTGKSPLILLGHEVRHSGVDEDGQPVDEALLSFLKALSRNNGPAGRPWDLVVQELKQSSDVPVNIISLGQAAHPGTGPGAMRPSRSMGRLSSLLGASTGNNGTGSPMLSSGTSSPKPGLGSLAGGMRRTDSDNNLAAEAHVRAVPLGARPVRQAMGQQQQGVNQRQGQGLAAASGSEALASAAATQPAGTFLLLTLM